MASTTVQIPSLCIPRVYIRFDQRYIEEVFCEIFGTTPDGASCIDHIDLIQREDRNTSELFHVAFVHFVPISGTPETKTFIDKINAGQEVKIEYSYPWFWKVRKNNAKKHTRRGPRIMNDQDERDLRSFQKEIATKKTKLYTEEDYLKSKAKRDTAPKAKPEPEATTEN